ncbi:MAG: iron-binding protein [Sulfurimonadaceae bacterium]|jgi:hypothetical protein|nr:iron-binding protein [Sulfurimonadaceae bacterium]
MNSNIYKAKHKLWLEILFASFAINDEEIKTRLYDFSQIAFRHMKWMSDAIVSQNDIYNYERNSMVLFKRESVFELVQSLKNSVLKTQSLYQSSALSHRISTDDDYLVEYLNQILKNSTNNKEITAFNMKRKWLDKNLAQEQIDTLTMFLFEESYKEYELILVYAYMQARTKDRLHFSIFEDLIAESYFHLKSFGNMMAKMGILALPRELHELTYMVKDLGKFVSDGIKEEEAAKEMCKELSDAIQDEELSKFFDFINFQESYHIELMKKLL